MESGHGRKQVIILRKVVCDDDKAGVPCGSAIRTRYHPDDAVALEIEYQLPTSAGLLEA